MDDIFIKNMVCNRCIMVVEDELNKLGLPVQQVSLGAVHFSRPISPNDKQRIAEHLLPMGFELIDDKKSLTIEKIKSLIIDLIHHQEAAPTENLSDYLSEALHQNYHSLSNLFSEIEGMTIEKYFIAQRIEKAKELLVYDELSLSEIADRLNYSSVAYLSNQFKKVTGLSPTHFKKVREAKRKPLDQVGS